MKNINIDNVENLLSLQKSFNNTFEKKINEAKYNENIRKIKKMQFSNLKNIFESVSSRIYDKKGGLKLIKNYINEVKGSLEHSVVNKLYESITKPINIDNTQMFVNQVDSLLECVDKSKLKKADKALADIVVESVKMAINDNSELENIVENSMSDLNSSFNFLCENKKCANNLVEFTNSINTIVEYIENNNTKQVYTNDVSINEGLNGIDVSNLKEFEIEAMKSLLECDLSSGNENELFETFKKDCIDTINESLDDSDTETKSRLMLMKEKLNERKYNQETIIDDILKLSELKHTLK